MQDKQSTSAGEGNEGVHLLTNRQTTEDRLLDFGKKDVAGLFIMPPTRHVILHLNDRAETAYPRQ